MKSLFSLVMLITAANFAFAAEPIVTIKEGGADVVMEIRLDYSSRFKKSDVDAIINPENDRIQDLFKDPISLSGRNRSYDVKTSINAPMINMDFNCKLAYQQNRLGALTKHVFSFTEFDRLFKSSTIRVETKESGSNTRVSIVQVAVIKSSPYSKIKKVPLGMGVKTFKSKIVANLNKFQKSTGGI